MQTTITADHEIKFVSAIFIAFICMLFGANAVAIKISFTGLGPLTVAGLRFFIAGLTISGWAYVTGRTFRIKQGQIKHLLMLTIIFTIQLSLFYLGLSKTYASRGILISNLLPFFVLFLSHHFIQEDRISIKKLSGVLLGFTGVAVMFFQEKGMTADLQKGDMIIFLAVLLWSVNVVYTKKIIHNFVPFQLVFYPMIFSAPLFFLGGVFMQEQIILDLNHKVIAGLLYQIFVTASFGFVVWNSMLKKYGASALYTFVFITPITGVLLGGLLLGEPLTKNILFASVLIASAIFLVHFRVRKNVSSYTSDRSL